MPSYNPLIPLMDELVLYLPLQSDKTKVSVRAHPHVIIIVTPLKSDWWWVTNSEKQLCNNKGKLGRVEGKYVRWHCGEYIMDSFK